MTDTNIKEGFLHTNDSVINIASISAITIDKLQIVAKKPNGIVRKLIKPDNLLKSKKKLSNISGLLILCIIIIVTIQMFPSKFANNQFETSLYWCSPFVFFAFVYLVQGVYYRISAYNKVENYIDETREIHALTISTSSGDKHVIKDEDLSKLTSIRDSVVSHVESVAKKIVNYNVTSDTVTINNETKNINTSYIYGNQIIQNINNYDIELSGEDKEFLRVDFQKALIHVQREILNQNDLELQKRFNELKLELNVKRPQKTKLISIFSMIKGLKTASDFVEAANTIMQGFNLFS